MNKGTELSYALFHIPNSEASFLHEYTNQITLLLHLYNDLTWMHNLLRLSTKNI